ncbi:MAG TPA: hypothetical protein VGP12_05545 [Nitrosospira sp.]|nr:hypothetical protein [Nitrosospira sp.]
MNKTAVAQVVRAPFYRLRFTLKEIMIQQQEEMMAVLANDLFNKRQRLIRASQTNVQLFDNRSAETLDAEYRTAESEYQQAKAAFARAMNGGYRHN